MSLKIIVVNIDHIGSLGWYCQRAFLEMGHQAELFDYRKVAFGYSKPATKLSYYKKTTLKIFRNQLIQNMNRKFLNFTKTFNPDLILIIKGEIILPETIRQIKEVSKVAVWFADSPFNVLTSSINIVYSLPEYDACLVFDPYYIPEMIRAGVKQAEYLPFACDPSLHRKIELTKEEKLTYGSDICFIGNFSSINPHRTRILQSLSGFNLRIWGNGWEKVRDANLRKCIVGRPAYGEEMVKIYNASKIAINIHSGQSILGVNMRTFEAPACGCFLLTDKLPELTKFYELNKEVVCYKDIPDLKNKVKFYLESPDKRKEIVRRAQIKTQKNHTYIQRMKKIIKIIRL